MDSGNDPRKCVVLVPVAKSVEPETQDSLAALASRGYAVRLLRDCSDIALGRSCMATEALRDGFTETFWIDSDTAFDPGDVDRLRAHDLPFVAGLYVRKGRPEFAAKFRECFTGCTFGDGGGLVPMEAVGMGFTLVRSEVYRALGMRAIGGGYEGRTVTPFFLPAMTDEGYQGEDYAFCRRASWAGFPPMADTSIKLGHVGRYTYTWDDLFPRERRQSFRVEFQNSPPG